jgi:hypothetical protein
VFEIKPNQANPLRIPTDRSVVSGSKNLFAVGCRGLLTIVRKETAMIALKALCAELNVNPRKARQLLRKAAEKPRTPLVKEPHRPWRWKAGSKAEREARKVLGA